MMPSINPIASINEDTSQRMQIQDIKKINLLLYASSEPSLVIMLAFLPLPFGTSRMVSSRPFLHLIKLLTPMLCIEVWGRAQLCSRRYRMQKGSDIRIAHESDTERINAMINMLPRVSFVFPRRRTNLQYGRNCHRLGMRGCHYSRTDLYTCTAGSCRGSGCYGKLRDRLGRRRILRGTKRRLGIC